MNSSSRFRLLSWASILGFCFFACSSTLNAAIMASGTTLDLAHPVITYTGGPLAAGNPTPIGGGPPCPPGGQTCESFAFTLDLPADFETNHSRDGVRIDLEGLDTADMFLHLLNEAGQVLQSSDGNGTGGGEQLAFDPAPGTVHYQVRVGNFAGAIAQYKVKISLVAAVGTGVVTPGPCDAAFGARDITCAGAPRYQNFYAPNGTSAQSGSQGEYNIGFNRHTGRILNMNIGPIWRITPPEVKAGGAKPYQDSGYPESCPEFWENVSDPRTNTGLDPILTTDWVSGRTFATNSTAGAVTLYTDTDGGDPPANNSANSAWIQATQSANGGADHEAIGSGPFPAAMSALSSPANQGQWVVYCSQDLYAPSSCQRSLTLGTSWETPYPATGLACAGLHGHPHIAQDGTAYMPVKHCNPKENGVIVPRQGGSLSTDTSTSVWTEFYVGKPAADADGPAFTTYQQPSGADPSIALDAASTLYYCYVNNEPTGIEGHVHVAVGKRTGTTIKWLRDTDVGASHGIINAAHTEAVGGSAGRAACGFIGTNQQGDFQAGTYPGMDWYVYIATTYDEGKTWTTVNATPNDPVQHNTGVWQQGGGGVNGNRNLLDFNEVTLDDKGRVLYGYSDGCVTADCISKVKPGNDKRAWMRVARQVGGKTLNAAYDAQTDTSVPVVPRRACLLDPAATQPVHPNKSTRVEDVSHLHWLAPDNGGADLTGYDILRSNAQGGPYVLIGSTAADVTDYDDATAGVEPVLYYVVRAKNAVGTSADSNEIVLAIGAIPENVCVAPGLTVLTDTLNDSTDTLPSHDVQRLRISEPYRKSATDTLTFTLKMASLATVPADTYWPIQFNVGGTTYTVRMSTFAPYTPAAPGFEYYQGAINTLAVGPATAVGDFKADGTITIVVPRNGIGSPAVASDLTSFLVRIAVNVGGGVVYMDNMPDNFTATGAYTVVGNGFCRANLAPTAALVATPLSGNAPLMVSFDASGSSDPDTDPPADTIASYTFDFGDGSPPVTQSSASITHVYSDEGEYFAELTVSDSRGLASADKAEVELEVEAPLPNVAPVANAGGDFAVDEGSGVLLSGSATDADGDTLSYAWTQLGGPTVALVNPNTAAATFVAPDVDGNTALTFRLTVSDGRGGQDTDDVTITVRDLTVQPGHIGNNAPGGAMPLAVLVFGLLGLALRRRR